MIVQLQRETLHKVEEALRAVIDQYQDDDYAEGDSYAVRLSREALGAIEAESVRHLRSEVPTPPATTRRKTDH